MGRVARNTSDGDTPGSAGVGLAAGLLLGVHPGQGGALVAIRIDEGPHGECEQERDADRRGEGGGGGQERVHDPESTPAGASPERRGRPVRGPGVSPAA